MTPTNEKGFKALFKFLNGSSVGQVIGRNINESPKDCQVNVVFYMSHIYEAMKLQMKDDLNQEVLDYMDRHLALLVEQVPEIQKQMKDHINKHNLNENTDIKEAVNQAIALGKKITKNKRDNT